MDQEYTVWERIRFLLLHMMQMELLLVLLGTAVAAILLSITLKRKSMSLSEQTLARNIAAVYAGLTLLLWLSGRCLR